MSRVERKARELFLRLGCEVPVNPYEVAEACGLEVVGRELEDSVSGMLILDGNRGAIGVNRSHHPNRQRFTIAHELGHYLLHAEVARVFIDGSGVFYRNPTSAEGTERQEIEANSFAAELLMPEAVLRERVGNHPVDGHDDVLIRKIADEFCVSSQALTIRLTRIQLISG